MTGHRPFAELNKKFSPGRKARIAAKVQTLKAPVPLAELRQARGRPQVGLARKLKVKQPAKLPTNLSAAKKAPAALARPA
jgi:hypothetical protein